MKPGALNSIHTSLASWLNYNFDSFSVQLFSYATEMLYAYAHTYMCALITAHIHQCRI